MDVQLFPEVEEKLTNEAINAVSFDPSLTFLDRLQRHGLNSLLLTLDPMHPKWHRHLPLNTIDYVKYFMDKFHVQMKLFTCPFTSGYINYDLTKYLTTIDYPYLGGIDESQFSYFRNDYHSPRQIEQSENWWVLMTDKAKRWEGAPNTNHWINGQMAASLLFMDGHIEHQTNVWPGELVPVPLFLVNYGHYDQWDFDFRILWRKVIH